MRLPIALLAIALLSLPARAGIVVSYEAPGVEATTERLALEGVETFDTRPLGTGEGFTTDFGTGGRITGTFGNVGISPADIYGGAGGTGRYAAAWGWDPFTLALTRRGGDGVSYFGLWLPALDSGNMIEFYSQGRLIETFGAGEMLAAVGGNRAYYGNPDAPNRGADGGEAFAFVNFTATAGTMFDTLRFSEACCGGFESDNFTVGLTRAESAPEPATPALLALGLAVLMTARTRDPGREAYGA